MNTENKLVLPQPSTDYLKNSFHAVELSCGTTYPQEFGQATSLKE